MRIAYYTDSISEHQVPLVRELIKYYGEESIRYFYLKDRAVHRKVMMGADAIKYSWTRKISEHYDEFRDWVEHADILYTIFRDSDIFENRIANGLRTFYMSERWLKPPTGVLRLLYPKYALMAKRVNTCFKSGLVTYLPTGVIAATDMLRVDALMNGNISGFLFAKRPSFDHQAGGAIYGYPWMRMWGYFVAASQEQHYEQREFHTPLKVLWVGRYLALKKVDTIIKAVKSINDVELDLFGVGPEEERLKKIAGDCPRIAFHTTIPLQEVRRQMRLHDVYVMSSNGFDGWGAVVSEAIEEGMMVLGTYECGGTATLLPLENLFHVGDWMMLAKKLSLIMTNGNKVNSSPKFVTSNGWTAKDAAEAFIKLIGGKNEG